MSCSSVARLGARHSLGASWLTTARRGLSSSSARLESSSSSVDVCVVGGGVVGTALACALKTSPMTSHLSVMLVDRAPAPTSAWLDHIPDQPEARVSALTPASVALLREVGAWDRIAAAGRPCPFHAMQVWDAKAAGHVRYAASEVGAAELGHVVENRVVHTALHEAATRLGVSCPPPAAVSHLNLGDAPGHLATVTLDRAAAAAAGEAGETVEVKARLVVGADGARSNVRALAGLRAPGWRYGLKAVVGTVTTEAPHTTAWQRFLPGGPLALLPVGRPDGRMSNVVWTCAPGEADRLAALAHDAFAAEVHAALHGEGRYDWSDDGPVGDGPIGRGDAATLANVAAGGLNGLQAEVVSRVLAPATRLAIAAATGKTEAASTDESGLVGGPKFESPPRVIGASGMKGAFPLATQHAGRYTLRRLALVGDAAHQVHPLGGQGVNLGIRDARLLVEALAAAAEAGGDVGSTTTLDRYAVAAARANLPMMAALDALQRLFAADAPLVAWARGAGLAGVNALKPLRQHIAKYAMGGA